MKKLLSLLTVFLLCVSIIPAAACGPESEPEYSAEYSYDDTYHWRAEIGGDGYTDYEAHVNNKGMCKCGKYFECAELTYKRVSIKDASGNYQSGLMCLGDGDDLSTLTYKHILVPTYATFEGETLPVLAINYRAFNCELIESVKLNEGLLSIGGEAFGRTTKLKEVIVPDSVISLGTSMMWEAKALERFVFGTGCSYVPGYMFYSNANLREVVMTNSIKKIGVVAFTGCHSLEYVVVPESVETIAGDKVPPHNDFGPSFNGSGIKIFMEHTSALEGFHTGWSVMNPVYWKNEWHYDENGKPVPNA